MIPQVKIGIIIAVLAVVLGSYWYAYHAGGVASDERHAVIAAKLAAQVQAAVDVQIKFGNTVAQELERANAALNVKQIEVIKYVPKFTNNSVCLSSRAVRLLNYGETVGTSLPPSPSEFNEKGGAGLAATDRDVSYWIADARARYQTCAMTLNSLVEFEMNR